MNQKKYLEGRKNISLLLWYASYVHICLHRGLSSVVRKCVLRENGQEFAVKIIDKSQDNAIKESIEAEVEVLRYLPYHPSISE